MEKWKKNHYNEGEPQNSAEKLEDVNKNKEKGEPGEKML